MDGAPPDPWALDPFRSAAHRAAWLADNGCAGQAKALLGTLY
jgi:hypothetical protein